MEDMTHIFRTFFVLGEGTVMLIQARYCPIGEMIRSVQIHPIMNGVVGPILMTENSLDANGIARLHAMIFNPEQNDGTQQQQEAKSRHQR